MAEGRQRLQAVPVLSWEEMVMIFTQEEKQKKGAENTTRKHGLQIREHAAPDFLFSVRGGGTVHEFSFHPVPARKHFILR